MFEKKNAQTLLRLFASLSDEEKEKFLAGVKDAGEETPETAQDGAEATETVGEGENTPPAQNEAQTAEKEAQDASDAAPAAEEPPTDAEHDGQATDPAAEGKTETEENAAPAEDAEKAKEADDALLARITALEELVAKISETVGEKAETDEGKTFGTSPSAPEDGDDALAEDDRIMRRYYAKQGYRH